MAIQLAESQQGVNHLQINTAHAGAHIADALRTEEPTGGFFSRSSSITKPLTRYS